MEFLDEENDLFEFLMGERLERIISEKVKQSSEIQVANSKLKKIYGEMQLILEKNSGILEEYTLRESQMLFHRDRVVYQQGIYDCVALFKIMGII